MWQNQFLQADEATSKISVPAHCPFKKSTRNCTQKLNYQTNTSIETVDSWNKISEKE